MVAVTGRPTASQPASGHIAAESSGVPVADQRQGAVEYQAAAGRPDRFTGVVERLWARPAWVAPLAVLACFAGASSLLLSSDPTDGRADAFGGCAVKMLTGFDCPGCGGTRAFWYLLHGNLPEAARHHLFAVFAAPFLVYLYVAWAGRRLFGWRIPQLWISPRMIGWFLAGWGVFMVLRNLPWAPFTLLYV